MAAIALGLAQGTRPFGMRSATAEFDAAVAYARTLAGSSGNGATLVFTTARTRGFVMRLYSGRPVSAGAMTPAAMPPMSASGDIAEATLGPAPFSLFFDSSGHVTGVAGAVTPSSQIGFEPPCPGGGQAMAFTFGPGRAVENRTLACRQEAAGVPALP